MLFCEVDGEDFFCQALDAELNVALGVADRWAFARGNQCPVDAVQRFPGKSGKGAIRIHQLTDARCRL